ncbi:glycosyltransferase [Stenotrophomonas geniculata]|jgi:UDP-N-acetylglucosamine transferase subunit ALG13|uniref:glycosyltransferase n=1 Tax=Stenotrophomonas geniculata TaxID=86188 RepID=UPI0006AA0FED|nr:glycosyltransferase [Stenotrophomonas geniculata]ALA88273.1 hypothetical protein YH67_19150 [Stenotrophomonas maltophilia]ALA92229.1 hypothetical protein YH68_19150 [Stenotrophomonas maltophilia]MCI1103850.1 hypothetical protein [Stenotrophomonas maltophilia]MDH7549516.1 glycosyltransferase [Stenotrophomonas geniculata]
MIQIFASVGTQAPFPRLIDYVSQWLSVNSEAVGYAQSGPSSTAPSFGGAAMISMPEFSRRISECDVLVTHAGMGNIIRALEEGVPAVIIPRQHRLGEHVNDHQVDTAAEFSMVPGIFVCSSADEFEVAMRKALAHDRGPAKAGSLEKEKLLQSIRDFLSAG